MINAIDILECQTSYEKPCLNETLTIAINEYTKNQLNDLAHRILYEIGAITK